MNSKERVCCSIEHKKPDWVSVNFEAVDYAKDMIVIKHGLPDDSPKRNHAEVVSMSTMFRRFLAFLLLAIIPTWSQAQESSPIKVEAYKNPVKLACIGDSITQGVGAGGQAWPSQIQKMLGDKWEVGNFGLSGRTLLNSGDIPYQRTGPLKKAKDFNPDVVVILLGTNDTKPQNWKHKDNFTADYINLIQQFAELPSKPRIFICYPPYIATNDASSINEPNTLALIPLIDKAAKSTYVHIIDVHGALVGKDALIPDRVHPNAAGAAEIAKAVYKALTGTAAPDHAK